MPTIEADRVSVALSGRTVLDDVSISIADSSPVALLGANGAGKSTLLHALAGVRRPDSGTVRLLGRDPYKRAERSEALSAVALVPQVLDFPGNFTVGEFLSFMAFMRGVRKSDRTSRVEEALDSVDLTDRRDSRLRSLSGGMSRRAAIAQGMLAHPRVLLLDEPTAGLDPDQRDNVLAALRGISGRTDIIFSTHLADDVAKIARHVFVLAGERIVFDGSVSELSVQRGDSSSIEENFIRLIRGGGPQC